MTTEKLPAGTKRLTGRPQMLESGYLYFEVEPWSQSARVFLKIPSRCTLRAVRYWLNRIADWHDTGCVTHIVGCNETLHI